MRNEDTMPESTEAAPNRREFCRVDAYIPLEYRLIKPEEQAMVKSRITGEVTLADFTKMLSFENDSRMEYLNHLNKKLDAIIQILALQFEGFHALPYKFVSLSGNGMTFSSQTSFSPGDVLEFKMILSCYQPAALYVYGEVIRVERQTSGYFITTRFTAIDDMIHNEIIHFIFEKEREMLRERRCGG
jgi:hypothetical protein